MTPFVSVVVPVLDDAAGIRITLQALLEQAYPRERYEVLVTDNGSEDGTREVVAAFERQHPDRVRLLTELGTRSSYAARNTGIDAARGEILAFTDADCVPAPEWIEAGVRALDSGAAYAAGRVEMTYRAQEPNIWEFYDAVGKMNQKRYMERYGFGATANLFVRRAVIEAHGRFRGDLVSGGDYEFGRRLAGAGENGVYAEDAVVRHPARSTASAILQKQRRILRGRRQLEALGLLEHGLLTWRSFLPVRRCPPLAGRVPGLPRRLAFLVVANAVRYYMLGLRLLGGRPGVAEEAAGGRVREGEPGERAGGAGGGHD